MRAAALSSGESGRYGGDMKPLNRTKWVKVALAVTVAAASLYLWNRNTVPGVVFAPEEPLRTQQTDAWLDVVQRGYHEADHLVATATNQPFSHVAVLDMERGEVIEAIGAGIQTLGLRERLHTSHHVMVMRPRWWREERASAAIAAARAQVGGSYDFLGTVGLGAKDRFYCSELAVHIYRPYFQGDEKLPGVLEPGHMYLWGEIVYDSRGRN
jgi:hypothetical protein